MTTRTSIPNWQFRLSSGEVVLHYWPSAKRGRTPDGTTVEDIPGPHDALLVARQLLGEADKPDSKRETADIIAMNAHLDAIARR